MTDTTQLLERVARFVQNHGIAEGLNSVQWETIRYLNRANRFSCSPSALTDYLGVTKGTVSQTINAIERKGLVKKNSVPTDARAVHIELTPSGKRLLKKDPLDHFSKNLAGLSERSLKQLDSSLRHILEASLRQRGGSAFGVCHSCKHFETKIGERKSHRCDLLKIPLTTNDSNLICREHAA